MRRFPSPLSKIRPTKSPRLTYAKRGRKNRANLNGNCFKRPAVVHSNLESESLRTYSHPQHSLLNTPNSELRWPLFGTFRCLLRELRMFGCIHESKEFRPKNQ